MPWLDSVLVRSEFRLAVRTPGGLLDVEFIWALCPPVFLARGVAVVRRTLERCVSPH
jgi:hypothetical protein